jgi:hypothetical protein
MRYWPYSPRHGFDYYRHMLVAQNLFNILTLSLQALQVWNLFLYLYRTRIDTDLGSIYIEQLDTCKN